MRTDVSNAVTAGAVHRWNGRVPILLGVTGHRNIDTKDKRLIAALKEQCALLRERYEHSPFIILSSLAEGADRLVAEIAMETLPADLIAVLPMPEEEYERDFASEQSKSDFRALLDRALYVKIVSVPDDMAWKAGGEPRNVQYARAGAIVADHAQILFAIWDGQESRGTGGTADLVKWFERGFSPNEYSLYKNALSPLDPLEPGRRIRIDPSSAGISIAEGPKLPDAKTNISGILSRTDKYNGNVIHYGSSIAESTPLAAGIEDLAIAGSVYRASDSLSVRFANSVRGTDSIIYSLAMGAVVSFNFISEKIFAPWIYLGITFVMLVLGSHVWFRSIDNRFLEYRCLAEAMRTLFFWRKAGVTRSVWFTYLSRQSGVVHWIRHAVRSVEFCQDCHLPPRREAASGPNLDGVRVAKTAWVDDQMRWFERKEREHYRRFRFWLWIARLAIGASFITAAFLAALTVVPNGAGGHLWDDLVKDYGDLWQAALGLFAAGGLAARGFLSRRAHLELMKQYASQRQIFAAASRMLETIETGRKPDWTAEAILEKLGEEALDEQAEWLWLRHTRPFELPAA